MKIILGYILLAFATAFSITGCGQQRENKQEQATTNQDAQSAEYYTCPMHPSVRSDKPGACPVCHMSLVKVSAKKESGNSSEQREPVELSNADLVLANVSTAVVEYKTLVKSISAVGKIDLAESSTKQITSRFGGRIERLFILCCGQTVLSGEPVAEIYSPEAVAAQQEFLVAMNSPISGSGDSSLLMQTRSKLKLWGFTDSQFDQLSKNKIPATNIIIYSPVTGTVFKKNVDLQQYIVTGQSLFDIADLRSVWLQLDVYESDITSIHIGQAVEASVEALPSTVIRGTVSSINPLFEPTTRTARVRIILPNPSGILRPEMYARASIRVPLQKSLVVPATAVVSNGESNIVWIESEPGHFEPRQVVLGERSEDFYQILQGIHEGESVAIRGAYLIDSESQLRRTTTGEMNK